MKFIENFVKIVAYLSLTGILFSGLVAKGILESNAEMCVPRAIATFVCGAFCSVVVWAALMLLANISKRLRKLENKE